MGNYNRVVLMGNLVKDPELKTTNGGKQVVNFTIAVNRRWNGPEGQESEEVFYIDCEAWSGQAKVISDYFAKGRPILVEGRLKQDRWEKDDKKYSRLVVVVENFHFVDSKKTISETIPASAGNADDMTDEEFDAI